MDPLPCQVEEILDLDARHDDLLERLADLDKRVARCWPSAWAAHGKKWPMGEPHCRRSRWPDLLIALQRRKPIVMLSPMPMIPGTETP